MKLPDREEDNEMRLTEQLESHSLFYMVEYGMKGGVQSFTVDYSVLVFHLWGDIYVNCNGGYDLPVNIPCMMLFPANSRCFVRFRSHTLSVVCTLESEADFCNHFLHEQSRELIPKKFTYHFKVIPLVPRLNEFMHYIKNCMDDGLDSSSFQNLLREELYILLRKYYSKEDLQDFFYPLTGRNLSFKRLVLQNHLIMKDIKEFADFCNMSPTTFKRRFRETFNASAYQWMIDQKKAYIYKDLVTSEKPFSQIAEEYHISSQSYLTAFCKRHFGHTPQDIRKGVMENTYADILPSLQQDKSL